MILADQPTCRIVRLSGVEAELELAWSGLAGLLDGLLDGIDKLPPARASAVRAALALEGVDEPVEPFAIALAARDILVDAAEDAPMVVFVDDLQWVDAPTRRTLSYIARRLQFERLAIVSTRRSGERRPHGHRTRRDPGRRHRRRRRLDPPRRRRHQRAGAAGADQRRRRDPARARSRRPTCSTPISGPVVSTCPTRCPIGSSGQRVVDLLLERLPPDRAVGAPDRRRRARRRPRADHERPAPARPRDRGPRGGRGQRHRHARRGSAGLPAPADALGRLPRRTPGGPPQRPPGAGQHDARGLLGAGLAPGSGRRRSRRGRGQGARRGGRASPPSGVRRPAAARSWELASRLSPEPTDRVRRLRLAATAILDAGMASAAGRLLERADAVVLEYPHADDLIERIRRQQLRCRLPPSSGGTSEPTISLRQAASEVAGAAPGRRRRPALRRARRLLPRRRVRRHGQHDPRGRGPARARRRGPGPAHRRDGGRAASSPTARPAARCCSTGTPR